MLWSQPCPHLPSLAEMSEVPTPVELSVNWRSLAVITVTRMSTNSASHADAKKVDVTWSGRPGKPPRGRGFRVNTQAAAQTRPCMGRNVEGWA